MTLLQLHLVPAVLATVLALAMPAAQAAGPALAAAPAQAATGERLAAFDGAVEAVRQAVVAAQVAGAVVQLDAKVGDRVAAGQLLLRIDARAAEQAAAAGDAQVQAARAGLELATRELERQRQLLQQNYISRAAFERAEAEFKSTQAQASAQLAQAGATRTQSGFYLVRAPFAGIVSEVPVALGDMAMPGRPLVTIYDPTALRIAAAVPQSAAPAAARLPRVELPGLPPPAGPWVTPTRAQVLPTVDAATHTVLLRAELPPRLAGVVPGMFARLWLPLGTAAAGTVSVPATAIVRRAEMTGLYVLGGDGQPLLRQVRLGRTEGERIEILSGLTAGERVVADPQAAARAR
ncbi:efflux RND transporter periplasmic adaptor subunit [Rubrivivax sp. A210]|uniref:efflux RND transporter periplasmic adaptor subunit n=1 Tax=Rubrivivax sp. A210 TaxID=2772301 RepID=UPI001F179042|nr:efflux RND transporter periplasmic adaptor subunit [Rubrivivax sp. A210]